MIELDGREYELKRLSEIEELFYSNYLNRRLVGLYRVPLDDIEPAHRKFVSCDLNCVRYRCWLSIRQHDVTMEQIEAWITDENAVDVYTALNEACFIVLDGIGGAAAAAPIEQPGEAACV